MKRPTKNDIRAAVDLLKGKPTLTAEAATFNAGKLVDKKSSQRIRKQGI